jgi:valyl-tRNA synthetase
MGQYCVGDIPFSEVFIHAMIQDGQGRKMSKSLGNGIDPLDIIDSHGADAMRFALTSMTTQTQDVRMPVEPLKLPDGRTVNTSPKFDIGRNFCNKLWNASRFALDNIQDLSSGAFDVGDLALEDRWILSRLADTVEKVTAQFDAFKFSEPINLLYRFFWNELCDWYLELIKPRMRDAGRRPTAQHVLAFVMDGALRLLHPAMPYITESIYQNLHQLSGNRRLDGLADIGTADYLAVAPWPCAMAELINPEVEKQMQLVQTTIRLIRDIRTRYQVPPRQPLKVYIKATQQTVELLTAQTYIISNLAYLETLEVAVDCTKPAGAAIAVSDDMEIYVVGAIDVQAERNRLEMQRQETITFIERAQAKLNNENFIQRAKPDVVQRQREQLAQLQEQLAGIEKNLTDLQE